MTNRTPRNPILAISLCFVLLLVPAAGAAEEDVAKTILKTMSDYIGSRQSVELIFDSDIEIITPQLEKIQFTNSGSALLSRPDKLYAHRRGGHADVQLFFDGNRVSIHEKTVNGYVQFDAPGSVDQLIEALREGDGIALPGADLLLSNPYDVLIADTMEAKYIGRGIVDGRECEHLAFRNFDSDWQLWVEVGETPVPCKMVITSKIMASAPQYTLHVRSWNTSVTHGEDTFVFIPPTDAEQLEHDALIMFDELPPEGGQGGKR